MSRTRFAGLTLGVFLISACASSSAGNDSGSDPARTATEKAPAESAPEKSASAPTASAPSAPKKSELSADDRKLLEQSLGKDVLGAAVADVAIDVPTKWLGLTAGSTTYRATDGAHKGHEVKVTLSKHAERGGGTTWHEALGPDKTIFLQLTSKGEIEMTSTQNSKEGTVMKFTPSAPVLLPDMKPGESKSSKHKAAVYDFSHPDTPKHEGDLEQEITHLGNFTVTVPAGTFEAALVKTHTHGKVGPAKIEDVDFKLLVQGTGLVALVDKKDIAAGIFYKKHDKAGLVRLKAK